MFRLFTDNQQRNGLYENLIRTSWVNPFNLLNVRNLLLFTSLITASFNGAKAKYNASADTSPLRHCDEPLIGSYNGSLEYLPACCTAPFYGKLNDDCILGAVIDSKPKFMHMMRAQISPDIDSVSLGNDLAKCYSLSAQCYYGGDVNLFNEGGFTQEECFDLVSINEPITKKFGKNGLYDGSKCIISYTHEAWWRIKYPPYPHIDCVIDTFEKHCGSLNEEVTTDTTTTIDSYTPDSIILNDYDIVFISLCVAAGTGIVAMLVFMLHRNCKMRNNNPLRIEEGRPLLHDASEEISSIANNSDIESLATVWGRLYDELESLVEENPKLQDVLDRLEATMQDHKCGITYAIPNIPAKLPCDHKFDFTAIVEWQQVQMNRNHNAECPCCRTSFTSNDIELDYDMWDELDKKFERYTQVLELANSVAKGRSGNQVSLRSQSSTFYSEVRSEKPLRTTSDVTGSRLLI